MNNLHKNERLEPVAGVMREQAYLVGRGVRSFAIVDSVENVPEVLSDAHQMLNEVAVESAGSQASVPIPFLIHNPDTNRVDIGYASHGWAVDVYEWLFDKTLPAQMVSRILGLLLGYSGEAIAQYEFMQAGQRVSLRGERSSDFANHAID